MYKPNEIYTPIKKGIKKGLQYIAIAGLGALMLGTSINNTYGQEKPKDEFKFEVLKEKISERKSMYFLVLKNIQDEKIYSLYSSGLFEYLRADALIDVGDTLQFKPISLSKANTEFTIDDIKSINGLELHKDRK